MKHLLLLAFLSGCVPASDALSYATRAYPECKHAQEVSHSYNTGWEKPAQTEVRMTCDGEAKSITIKCIYGMGIISDTVCHENN